MPENSVTINEIKRYIELRDTRLALTAKANAQKDEEDQLKKKMLAMVNANRGKPVKKGKFTLGIKKVAASISWKKLFVEKLGSDVAAKIIKDATPREQLQVIS